MRLICHREDLHLISFVLEKVCEHGLGDTGKLSAFCSCGILNLDILFFFEVLFLLLSSVVLQESGPGVAFPDDCGWVRVRPGFWFHGTSARSEVPFLSTAGRSGRYE